MKLIEVQSSNIKAIGYESGCLFVEYPSGTYEYQGVPEKVYTDLMAAESKGSFMNQYIKGQYEYRRLFNGRK